MREKSLGMLAALIASASGASAATLTQTANYGPAMTNWIDDLSFAGFSSSLGTLEGVSILAVESTAGTLTNRNKAGAPALVTSEISNTWSAVLPGMLDGLSGLSGNTVSSSDSATLAGGKTGTPMQVSGSSQEGVALQPGQTLSPYEAAFSIDVTDNGNVLVTSSNGNGGALFTDSGKFAVQVVYTYAAAVVPPNDGNLELPEPATVALLGSGLLGIGVIGRSRRPGLSAVKSTLPA